MKRKKLLQGVAAAAAVALLLISLAGCHVWQQFGATPTADELAAYTAQKDRPYLRDGHFHNPEPLPFYPDRITGRDGSGWFRYLAASPNRPTSPLPTQPLDAASFTATPADLAVYWLGHSSLILELEGKRLLVDPVFGNAAPLPGVLSRYVASPLSREHLPPLDYVLLTHDHYDHLEYATMRFLRDKDVRFIVPLGAGAHLRKWGIPPERIHELGWGDLFSASDDDLDIIAEPAQHFSGRTFGSRDTSLWSAYVLKGKRHRLFIAGDTGYGAHFREIGAKHGPFDLAFLEIDAWNPGWPKTHLFPEEAIQAARDLGARAFVPVHWGVFDMAHHPWDESIRRVFSATPPDLLLLTPRMGEKLLPFERQTSAWWTEIETPPKSAE